MASVTHVADINGTTALVPKLPQVNQAQSPLLQLPAELRFLVLRNLLVTNHHLGYRSVYPESPPTTVERARDSRGRFLKSKPPRLLQGYHLTPEILQTCQSLYSEGLPILYNQNELTLVIDSDPKTQKCGKIHYYKCQDLRLYVPAATRSLNKFRAGDWRTSSKSAPLAARFRKIRLRVLYCMDYGIRQHLHMRELVQMLSNETQNRTVVIDIACLPGQPITSSLWRQARFLNQLCLLRIPEAIFVYEKSQQGIGDMVKFIETEVCGRSPVWNPVESKDKVYGMIQTLRAIFQAQQHNSAIRLLGIEEARLLMAWLDFDAATFEVARSSVANQLGNELSNLHNTYQV